MGYSKEEVEQKFYSMPQTKDMTDEADKRNKWYWGGYSCGLSRKPRQPGTDIQEYWDDWLMGYDDAVGDSYDIG